MKPTGKNGMKSIPVNLKKLIGANQLGENLKAALELNL